MPGHPDALAEEPQPDVLLIMIDDMNDWVGVLGGNSQAITPNIDALAARGMVFTNAHAVSTACLPSRTAMLTGVSPFISGVYDQTGDWRDVEALQELPTLPQYFREAGYDTSGAGKIFHAHTYREYGFSGQQDADAWDRFYPSFERQLPDEVKPPSPPTNGNPLVVEATEGAEITVRYQHIGFDWSPVIAEDDAMGDGQVVSWIERQLSSPANGPRFIAAGIYRPHLPWYVPPAYFDMHPVDSIRIPDVKEDDLDDVPSAAPFQDSPGSQLKPTEQHDWVLKNDLWAEAIQGYLASMSFADAMVGRIVKALDGSGRADRTIVVLVSDHGFHLGEKGRWRKMTLWEESTRVPLIIVAPGVTSPGSQSAEAVSLLDIFPTIAELAGLDAPGHADGQSLIPLLADAGAMRAEPAISVWGRGNTAVRDDRYRLIRYVDGSEELYDHDVDPNEWTNLADDERYDSVRKRLAEYIPDEMAPSYTGEE